MMLFAELCNLSNCKQIFREEKNTQGNYAFLLYIKTLNYQKNGQVL